MKPLTEDELIRAYRNTSKPIEHAFHTTGIMEPSVVATPKTDTVRRARGSATTTVVGVSRLEVVAP